VIRVFELSISVIYLGKCDCGERGLVNLYDELTYRDLIVSDVLSFVTRFATSTVEACHREEKREIYPGGCVSDASIARDQGCAAAGTNHQPSFGNPVKYREFLKGSLDICAFLDVTQNVIYDSQQGQVEENYSNNRLLQTSTMHSSNDLTVAAEPLEKEQARILPAGIDEETFNKAIDAVGEIIGEQNVSRTHQHGCLAGPQGEEWYGDHYEMRGPGRNTPSGAFRPKTAEEIQHIVKIANEYGIPLWVFSRGKNLGLV
jgi:hypothetical protein